MMRESTDVDFAPNDCHKIEVSSRLLRSALSHAARGYRVIPVAPGKNKKQLVCGLGTTDLERVNRWWSVYPLANVGINLSGAGLVVPDVDGPEGHAALSLLLRQAGVVLPETYVQRTGRGRHLWYGLPPGSPALATQYGHQHRRPQLDIKMSGLLVVAGSVHHSGAIYTGNWDHVPAPEELPALPEAVYQVLAAGGRLWTPRGRKRRGKSAVATDTPPRTTAIASPVGTRSLPVTGRAGRRLKSLLNDISHGRDGRIFCATRLMVANGCARETITTTVLSSPVGPRASKHGSDPIQYMAHKIACATTMVEANTVPGWDVTAYRAAAHTANLGSSAIRVMDYLLTLGVASGVVTKSTGLIAINTAMSEGTAAGALKRLRQAGWLRVLREFDAENQLPRTYGMFIPEGRQISGGVSAAPPPTPHVPDGSFSPRVLSPLTAHDVLSPLTAHDAFRSRARKGQAPTLHSAYPLLCRLTDYEQTTMTLSCILDCDQRTLQRRLADLRRAGLVVTTATGHRLTDQPIRPLLYAAAEASGTTGARRAQIDRYRAEVEKNRQYRVNAKTVNTPEWRRLRHRDAVEVIRSSSWNDIRPLLLDAGDTVDSLAEWCVDRLVLRLGGQPEVWEGFFETWDGLGGHEPWAA